MNASAFENNWDIKVLDDISLDSNEMLKKFAIGCFFSIPFRGRQNWAWTTSILGPLRGRNEHSRRAPPTFWQLSPSPPPPLDPRVRWGTCCNECRSSKGVHYFHPKFKVHSFTQLFKRNVSVGVVRNGRIMFHLNKLWKAKFSPTVWCNISTEVAGEIWNGSLLGVEGLRIGANAMKRL